MKSSIVLAYIGIFAVSSRAVEYTPFTITGLTTHEPNGSPDGQTNFWGINFSINSTNDHEGTLNPSTYCHESWGDGGANTLPPAVNNWIPCDNPQYSYKLTNDYTIENFTLAIQQNITEDDGRTQLISGQTLISNSTNEWTCDTYGSNVPGSPYHVSGDCYFGPNVDQVQIPVTNDELVPLPTCTPNEVMVSFAVSGINPGTVQLLLAGSIAELGYWDLPCAYRLSNFSWTGAKPYWTGTIGPLSPGTYLEYKYVDSEQGETLWDCGDNRQYTVPDNTCGSVTVDDTSFQARPQYGC